MERHEELRSMNTDDLKEDIFEKAKMYEPYEGQADGDHNIGKSWKYTPEEIWSKALEYFDYCANFKTEYPSARGDVIQYKKPRVPMVGEFLSEWLGVTNGTFDNWRKGVYDELYEKGYADGRITLVELNFAYSIRDTAIRIHDYIYNKKWSGLINGEGNAQGLIFDMKVNHGKNDKLIVEQTQAPQIQLEIVAPKQLNEAETGDKEAKD